MLRFPVRSRVIHHNFLFRLNSSSSAIRSTFIDYFTKQHGHKHIKSSSVVPLCDPTVPFVNAGMNQFKGVFLGKVDPPCLRAVNSQKCVRVGGKHNDLDVVGMDGYHHTFFEMLGNWSFGDYYKKEACQMAWDLLLGPYRLKPEDLVVTYFSGDAVIGLTEDRECRDIWKEIGVPPSRLEGRGAADNFWEMGNTGPCGPCTEIHYVNPDGSLTEIWNIVFIQCNREADGKLGLLPNRHVDTGMGLERLTALLQHVPTNYHTDLFQPIIRAIEINSKGVPAYSSRFGADASLDCAYRRLADHARMISVCLADSVFPATSLNLKQIMRKAFKISTDVFQNPNLLMHLYNEVAATLGSTYPELITREKQAKLIIQHEEQAYSKMRVNLVKKWKDLVKRYPEVEQLSDVEISGFALGYKEFKETMSKQKSTVIPGELVFKLYDTHGFQEHLIDRIAKLNNLELDKKGFWNFLSQHKSRHKIAFQEQGSNKGLLFENAIKKLTQTGVKSTNDQYKYSYAVTSNKIHFKPLRTKLVAILNEDCEWIDFLEPCENRPYYLVTEDTNFFCEEGGQISDSGVLRINEDVALKVDSVFKIRDFVFHKGNFVLQRANVNNYVKCQSDVVLEIDSYKRLNLMRNHTAVHLLNAAIRRVLPKSVVAQVGSSVTDKGLSLTLSIYGEKLSQDVILEAQELIRKSIDSNATVNTRVVDNVQLSREASVVTVPGETYPDTGIRLIDIQAPLLSRELCCGTHVPSTSFIEEFCITLVKGAGSHTPTIHALTSDNAEEARELFCRAQKLSQLVHLTNPERRKNEAAYIKTQLAEISGAGSGTGAAYGEYAQCLALLDELQKKAVDTSGAALHAIAEAEVREAFEEASRQGRRFVVHFMRCSYLMHCKDVRRAFGAHDASEDASAHILPPPPVPAILLGCAGGIINAVCRIPEEHVNEWFNAERWLGCVARVFGTTALPLPPMLSARTYAEMTPAKVSLITCEQLVQDAMRVAIKYAQAHAKGGDVTDSREPGERTTQGRSHN